MPETDTENLPTFDVLRLSNEVRKAVDELGYVNPTPVQRAIYEPAKKGRDLVVQARTGTGKTAAFGLPLVDGLVKPDVAAVQAMVLCPTRELALQVAKEITSLGRYRDLKVVSVYGGAPMQRQIDEIAAGAQILVGTPGRVLDHLRRGTLDSARIRVLVLDESDEMLSMGFLPQINEVLEALPKSLHTLLFSATVPRDVVRMAEDRLRDPSFITLSGDEIGALSIQHFTYLAAGDKLGDFLQVVETENPESAIIFCNTREQTKRVAHQLKQAGYDADWLNADLSQAERERVMAAVRESRLRFLVATDVAARGIDISHLTHVINYDFPESTEVYVHRTGRTGRAGRTGTAISMITPQDIGGVYMLKLTYRITPVERSLPSATEKRTRAELDLVEGLVRLAESRKVTQRDRSLARRLLTHDQAEIAIAMLLQDHLGPREEAESEAAKARRAAKPAPAPEARKDRRPGSANGKPEARERVPRSDEFAGAPTVPDSRRQRTPKPEHAAKPEHTAKAEHAAKPEHTAKAEHAAGRDRTPHGERAPKPEPKLQRGAVGTEPSKAQRAQPTHAAAPAPTGRGESQAERENKRDENVPRRNRRGEEREQRRERVAPEPLDTDEDLDLPGYVVEDASPSLIARLTDDATSGGGDSRRADPRGGEAAPDRPRSERARNERRDPEQRSEKRRGSATERDSEQRHTRENDSKQAERPDERSQGRRSQDRSSQDRSSQGDSSQAEARREERRPRRTDGEERRNGATRERQPDARRAASQQPTAAPQASDPAETHVTLRTPVTNLTVDGDPDSVREIRVNVGRKDGARPSDFRRTLVDRGALSDADTEHVNVRPDHTFVGVKVRVLGQAMQALNGATIAGKEASAELAPHTSC